MSQETPRVLLKVQDLNGASAPLMEFFGGGLESQLERASENAVLLASLYHFDVLISIEWPEDEE